MHQTRSAPTHFLLISQDESSRFASESCIAVLKCANALIREQKFTWEHVDTLGVLADKPLHSMARVCLVLVGGIEHPWHIDIKTQTSIKSRLQSAQRLCLVGAGVFVPLAIGALHGKALSVHPKFRAGVSELAYAIRISNQIVSHSDSISSAIGGMAASVMLLDLIGHQLGAFTKNTIEEYLGMRTSHERIDTDELRYYIQKSQGNQRIIKALYEMQDNMEETLSIRQIAKIANISSRQLERCFMQCLGESPLPVYRNLRLACARQLLIQTNLPILEISIANGFSSTSHFSKSYRERYNEHPVEFRKRASYESNPLQICGVHQ
jgi:transcriptional regulator GlxA family with amidase domain